LRCSQFVVKELKKSGENTVRVTIDLCPDRSEDEVFADSMRLAREDSKKAVKNILKPLFPDRLIPLLLAKAEIREDVTYDNIPKQPWSELAKLAKAFPVRVNGTLSIEEAFVTGGGVNLKEIDPKTMQSKRMPGLFFCGEVLDIHGYTGGYNITAAFTSGYTAGKSAGEEAEQLKLGEE
jgi:predicted Rossmann fold flavoprotein